MLITNLEGSRSVQLHRIIGARIKSAREALDMTQTDFAKAMGRSSSKWAWDIETGRTGLSVDELVQLARILHRPALWILGEGPDDLVRFSDVHVMATLLFRNALQRPPESPLTASRVKRGGKGKGAATEGRIVLGISPGPLLVYFHR